MIKSIQNKLLDRTESVFSSDLHFYNDKIYEAIYNKSILIIGGAGTIGRATSLQLLKYEPREMILIDKNENNLVESVRRLRSEFPLLGNKLKSFCLDVGSLEFDRFCVEYNNFDYVFNLSAMKHVRSERDPYTLMHMIKTNVLNTVKTLEGKRFGHKVKYFNVSTDKASNPVNLMGATKLLMENFLLQYSTVENISMARFANVAFSDGSLLHGFNQRLTMQQPITAPRGISRFFVTEEEAGQICLISGALGESREIFFPRFSATEAISFTSLADSYLRENGYEPYECSDEKEAVRRTSELIRNKYWPVYYFESDTTGEKNLEEFHSSNEKIDFGKFDKLGVIKKPLLSSKQAEQLVSFIKDYETILNQNIWTKEKLVRLVRRAVPELVHTEKNKNLDERM